MKKNEGREEKGLMRGDRKTKEEEEETRDGQLEGKRKPRCLVVGV